MCDRNDTDDSHYKHTRYRHFIMDPEYQRQPEGTRRRLREIPHLYLARDFITLLSKPKTATHNGVRCWGRSVDSVWLGGPGHEVDRNAGLCNPETGLWMEEFINQGCNMEWLRRPYA